MSYAISRKYAPSWQHHIVRYAFALPYCYRKSVLDAGSQIGYGGNLLSYVANSITFVDINQKYIDMALSLKNMCPVDGILCDFEKDFPEGKWDTVVAFEVIEHLENPDVFLANVAKHLNPGGRLVFSVPHMVANHEHKHVYDEAGIKALIGKHLKIVEFYQQDKNPITMGPLYKGLKCYAGIAICK